MSCTLMPLELPGRSLQEGYRSFQFAAGYGWFCKGFGKQWTLHDYIGLVGVMSGLILPGFHQAPRRARTRSELLAVKTAITLALVDSWDKDTYCETCSWLS